MKLKFRAGSIPARGTKKLSVFYTYILHSQSADRFYVGYCQDLGIRLQRHNRGGVPSTKAYRPWNIF